MFNDVLKLVSITNTKNNLGDIVQTKTERQVFCRVKSISQSEFYQASATGFKPNIKFALSDSLEYQGEEIVKYNSMEYRVIRTYTNERNEIELVCQKGVDI